MAIASTVALLAGATGWAVIGSGHTTTPSRWDPQVTAIVHFVEVERGLTFVHPVPVDFLTDSDFQRKIGGLNSQPSAAEQQALSDGAAELRALGLAEGSFDLGTKRRTLLQSQAAGVYVSQDKRVYVRGSVLTPTVRVVLAHELTHALQDQHGDLVRAAADLRPNNVRLALIEGDAVVVQRAYARSLSAADKAIYEADQTSGSTTGSSGVDNVLANDLAFPYVFGPAFIDALRAEGGTSRLDQAYLSPPTSEAQIVDPDRYLSGFRPIAVARPVLVKNQQFIYSDDIGQVSMLEVLGRRLGYAQAWTAVQGWQGDAAVVYRQDHDVCVAVVTAFDSIGHAASFESSATAWAAANPGAKAIRQGGAVELRNCDPGTRIAATATAAPPPFEVLSARAELLDSLLTSGKVAAAGATCTIDRVMESFGPQAVLGMLSNSGTVPVADVRAKVAAAEVACLGVPSPHDSQGGQSGDTPTTLAPPSPSFALDPPLGSAPLASTPVWAAPIDPGPGAARAGLTMLSAEGTVEHIHAHVAVVIDGERVIIPALVGIGSLGTPISEMHTHDSTGVVHIEAPHVEPFTLGQFFTEWGHPLGLNHIGAMQFGANRVMHVFVNGVAMAGDPVGIVLRNRDDVLIRVEPTGVVAAAPQPYGWPPGF